MKNILRIIALLFVISAILQLLGIGERIYHSLWQWYKFYGYSNSGHTTISSKMEIFAFLTSGSLILFGFFINRKAKELIVKRAIICSYSSLSIGVLLLAALLVSPIGKLVVT